MTPQQTKLAVAAAVVAVIVGGSIALNRATDKGTAAASKDGSETAGVDIRRNRMSANSAGGRNGSSSDDDAAKVTARKNAKNGDSAFGANSDLASIIDVATTTVTPIETDAETRERERYEEAMKNKFKYRETDPSKVKPTEVGPVLQDVTQKYDFPPNVLAAMMYVETGGTHRGGEHSMEAGYGVMNLRESNLVDTLGEGAALIGKTKEEVLYNQKLNIEAAGALLNSYYNDALASGLSESEALYAAIATYSGRSDPELAGSLADETAGMLMKGFELHLDDGGGDLVVAPNPNPPFLPKNWELVGMTPPTAGSGPQVIPGTIPPNAQSSGNAGSAAGDAVVSP